MSDIRDYSSQFEAVKLGIYQNKEGYILKLTMNPNDTPEEIMRDTVGQRYMVMFVRLSDQDEPEMSDDQRAGVRAVQMAGALCRNPQFQNWLLFENCISRAGEEEAVAFVCKHCGIQSRREMKKSRFARDKFHQIRDAFMKYLSRGQLGERRTK